MTLERNIRQTHRSGSWVYAIVEEVNLGYATVKLAANGSRLTNLPVTGANTVLGAGDACVVDYSAGIPPTVRALSDDIPEEDELELATVLPEPRIPPEEEVEPIDATYFVSGDHGVKAYQFGGTYINVAHLEPTTVTFTHVDWDTDEFFDSAYPGYITVPAPGFYFCIADLSWPPGAGDATFGPLGWGDKPVYAGQHFKASIQSNVFGKIGVGYDYPLSMVPDRGKIMQATGTGRLEAGERISLVVSHNLGTTLWLPQLANVYPRLTVQWLGNYES